MDAFRSFMTTPDREVTTTLSDLHGDTFETTSDDDAGLDNALLALKSRAGTRPPAVISSNAVMSLRVVAAMARLGWQLGRDVGLVGFDETEWSAYVGPGLSTIAQPTDELGRLAAGCLIERLKGLELPARQILLAGQLVPRGSSSYA
jgi:LacI family kdg operon repressor